MASALTTGGHSVRRLVRSQPAHATEFRWDPDAGELDGAALEGVDAVVHLSGESVAGRWSDSRKRAIRDSRVGSTSLLANAIARLGPKPQVFVCASAIGYYGDRGDATARRGQRPRHGLPGRGRARPGGGHGARRGGVRVVSARFGIVLSPAGGMLGQVLTPFRARPPRAARQWQAVHELGGDRRRRWRDQRGADRRRARRARSTSPRRRRHQRRVHKTLARVLHRPAFMKVPGFALKALVGEFAGEALGGQRVQPKRLLDAGYRVPVPGAGGCAASPAWAVRLNDGRLVGLTGATGYVGGRLLRALVDAGHRVRCLARRPELPGGARDATDDEVVGGDVPRPRRRWRPRWPASTRPTTSCTRWARAATSKRRIGAAAENFGARRARAGVRRIVYLGGLGRRRRPSPRTSRSRQEVGRYRCASTGVPVDRVPRVDRHRLGQPVVRDDARAGRAPAGHDDCRAGCGRRRSRSPSRT